MLLFHHRWPVRARALVACLLGAIGQGASAGAQLASSGASADVIGGWQLAMGASGAWRSNLQLEPSANANGLATAILSGEGSRFWQGRTDRVVLAVGGSILRIPQQPELDREAYDLSVLGLHQFTRRVNLSASARASAGITNRGITSNGDGALLPGFVVARSEEAATNASYVISRRTTGMVSAVAQRVAIDGRQDSRGSRRTVNADVTHRQGRFTTVGARFSYQSSESQGVSASAPQAAATAEHQLTQRVSLTLAAGVAFVTTTGQPSSKTLTGASSVAYRGSRSDFALGAQRTVGQEFGRETPAVQVTNGVALTAGRRLLSAWRLSGALAQIWSRSLSQDRLAVRSTVGNATASYALRAGPQLEFSVFAARRSGTFTTQDYGVSAGLGYAWSTLRRKSASGGA